ncbi:unnamed protein product [Chondrus crispus]|uniref:Uncharacterized protein n=1 Tax=Chondrus crispus TaxID=2769 RepID=R7QE15_CHOCR|nr:unnamed protein product [Chondrus crispus]CDF36762.1 unnamed protein product [Chondrus crispus]|eukprot:XP_005716581.1 unnamed protein product [Chondrus crispus]
MPSSTVPRNDIHNQLPTSCILQTKPQLRVGVALAHPEQHPRSASQITIPDQHPRSAFHASRRHAHKPGPVSSPVSRPGHSGRSHTHTHTLRRPPRMPHTTPFTSPPAKRR